MNPIKIKAGDPVQISLAMHGLGSYRGIIENIEIVDMGCSDGGYPVPDGRFIDITQHRVTVSLKGGRWAYGCQIIEVNDEPVENKNIKDRFQR